MTIQTKEQQAVDMAEKHGADQYLDESGIIEGYQLTKERLTAMLADHAQQVREAHTQELVANAGVMLSADYWHVEHSDSDRSCFVQDKADALARDGVLTAYIKLDKATEAIAAMKAQNERLAKVAADNFSKAEEALTERDELRARVAELGRALQGLEAAYCRAGPQLTKEERHEDRLRLIAARAAMKKGGGV